MKIRVNTKVIQALNPCLNRFYNWLTHYEDFNKDITKFLKLTNITHKDKLWVALRLIPLEMRVVFALDCSFAAAAYAADAAADDAAYVAAAYAAYTADAAANAAVDAAAAYAANAADAAADAAVDAAADAANAAAVDAANAAVYAVDAAEQNRQIEALIYLIKGE